MEQEFEFNLKLTFKDGSIIRLENINSKEIFQRINDLKPDFLHFEDFINQYVKEMEQRKINETKEFFVPEAKFKIKDWYCLKITRIK
jgi:hypothetical protein